jgi:sulfur carrier protein
MNITINGEDTDFGGSNVLDVVRHLGADAGVGVAVALNGEVVAKSLWSEATLKEGDRIEVLRAIGGG